MSQRVNPCAGYPCQNTWCQSVPDTRKWTLASRHACPTLPVPAHLVSVDRVSSTRFVVVAVLVAMIWCHASPSHFVFRRFTWHAHPMPLRAEVGHELAAPVAISTVDHKPTATIKTAVRPTPAHFMMTGSWRLKCRFERRVLRA